MLDFLLKNQPEFLQKFREYLKEEDVFNEAVIDYIKEKEIEMNSFSNSLEATYYFDKTYNGKDFGVTFSDNSNFILAKNKKIEDDKTYKAYIFIYSDTGSTRMNCHVNNYSKNLFPLDFTLEGIGCVEHFFLNETEAKIHEFKFGTWRLPHPAEESSENKILCLFPAILREDQPSIEIKFSQEDDNIVIQMLYNSGESPKNKFNICFQIDKKKSDFFISTSKNPAELESHVTANLRGSIQQLVSDSLSEWVSHNINLEELLFRANSTQPVINYAILLEDFVVKTEPKQSKNHLHKVSPDQAHVLLHTIHPAEKELREMEKSGKVEAGFTTRLAHFEQQAPNQKTKNPQAKNVTKEDWWVRLPR